MTKAYSYIRFSSEKQARGESLTRQLRLATKYAKKHNLELDSQSFNDLGVSAFRGKNAVEGRLGAFLEAIENGKIRAGSFLLIEDFDRLSRNEISEALTLFLQIINKGITIVTLGGGDDEYSMSYSKETVNKDITQLFASIMYMGRAHDESKRKSDRGRDAWNARRKDPNRLISGTGPAWLRKSADGKKWIVVQAKAKVVQRIFDMAQNGMGHMQITRTLNAEKVPGMLVAKDWSQGVVGALLRNPSVTGRFTQKMGGDQVIEGYYPAVISQEQFYAVQASIKGRLSKGSPRNEINNLFAGMTSCLYCGRRTRYLRNGGKHAYLRCLGSLEGTACDAQGMNYQAIERAILDRLIHKQKRDLSNTFFDPNHYNPNSPDVIEGRIAELKAQQENVAQALLTAPNVPILAEKLRHLEEQIQELKASRDTTLPITEEEVKASEALFAEHERLLLEGGTELTEFRRKMQVALRRQLQKVEIAPWFSKSELNTESFFSGKGSTERLSENPDFLIQLTYAGGSVRLVDATPFMSPQGLTRRARKSKG